MSETKTNILETVIEEISGEPGKYGKMNTKGGMLVSYKNSKGQKSSKIRHTKKVIVKLPTVSRKIDDENKVFPKGIESMRRKLEEIKEEAREIKIDNDVTQTGANLEDKENEHNVEPSNAINGFTTEGNAEILSAEAHKSVSDQIYGMFTRTNTERSLLSNRSDSVALSLPVKRNKRNSCVKRPKSSCGWTKKELDLFLPRKSFFSVHDNTLSVAGFDIRSDEERKRPEWRQILKMHTEDELHPPEKEEEKPSPVFAMMDDDSGDDTFGFENVETAVSAEGKDNTSGSKGKKKQSTKKAITNDKEEYKPLYDYLKYIHDNPEDYVQVAKYTGKNTDHKHPSTLVRMGRAYRRGHHGGHRNSIFLHAITGLKPKFNENTTQRSTRNEKTGTKKETDGTEPTITQDETEIEKLKSKAEKWMKNLTTQQYLKSRELALKDVGEEDINFSKWWLTFRSCHYLRIPSYISESAKANPSDSLSK